MNPFPKYNEKGELDTRLRVDPITGDVGIGTSKEKEHMKHDKTFEAINKLKEVELELHRLKNALEMTNRALETKDEPVAWMNRHGACKTSLFMEVEAGAKEEYTIPVYTQPQRTWVGLTDEDMNNALDYWSDNSRSSYGGAHAANGEYVDIIETWRYIEAKLKEKNHGN